MLRHPKDEENEEQQKGEMREVLKILAVFNFLFSGFVFVHT